MSEHVRVERESGVLSITLARPERRNAITVAMYAALADAIGGAANDPAVRLITLSGEGVDFTAGNDLNDFLNSPVRTGGSDLPVHRLMHALANNRIPLVAAVQGNAVGIGTTMLLQCDLVLAEEGCRFLMPFVDLGLVPELASSLIVPQLAGRRAAARTLLLAEPFGAEQALAMGIASHVVPRGELGAKLEAIKQALLAKPAEAMRLTQQLLRTDAQDAILERIALENGHFAERLNSDEVKQAIASFYAKKR
ncbi:MAG: enoyl-CoA hydratase-related protein [Sphingomicrobium sp.]